MGRCNDCGGPSDHHHCPICGEGDFFDQDHECPLGFKLKPLEGFKRIVKGSEDFPIKKGPVRQAPRKAPWPPKRVPFTDDKEKNGS